MDGPLPRDTIRQRLLTVGLPAILFAYLLSIRVWDISRTFWLFGDQTHYWQIALGPWHELPLGGAPSSVGGTTLGPIFVWMLWVVRHLIGPFTDNLPHAGGIGQSILQSLADAFLFAAIRQRFRSWPLALGVVLIAGSAPYDLALTATIWNPPVAAAFAKSAIACVLLAERGSTIGWAAGATVLATLTVQAHSSGLFLAAPVIASFPLRALIDGDRRMVIRLGVIAMATVLLLEVPYIADRLLQPEKSVRPVAVSASVAYTLAHPSTLRPAASLKALSSAFDFILVLPWSLPWMGWLLTGAAVVVLVAYRHDVTLACATVGPLVAAVAGFSLWQRAYDHYWFLPLAPGAMLTIGLALTAWRPATRVTAGALLAVALAAQPSRVAASHAIHRLPDYGSLVDGTRAIRRYTPDVRAIGVDYDLPAGVDLPFLYRALGGRLNPTARFDAVIHRSGQVSFVPAAGASR